MKKMLSIVTTIFNDYCVIDNLFKSLLCQTSNNFTHYIYDDGSSSIDEYKVKQYIFDASHRNKPYEVIFIKGNKNLGVNKAHEYIFGLIDTDYFCWIDSDDWVSIDFVSSVEAVVRKHKEVDVFHINSYRYDENRKRKKGTALSHLSKVLFYKDQYRCFCLDDEKFFNVFIIKKNTLVSINPSITILDTNSSNPFWYDAQLLFELAFKHSVFYMVKKPLVNILDRKNSVSRSVVNHNSYNTHQNLVNIFKICDIPVSQIEDYNVQLVYSKKQVVVLDLLYKRNLCKALKIYRNNKRFFNEHIRDKRFLVLDNKIRKYILYNIFFFVFRIRRVIINFFRKE